MRITRSQRAFTLLEITIAILIVAVLAGVLLVVFGNVKRSAKDSSCLSNLSQIGKALFLYAADYDDCAPPYLTFRNADVMDLPALRWRESLQPYQAVEAQFFCPLDPMARKSTLVDGGQRPNHLNSSYGHNLSLVRYFRAGTRGIPEYSLSLIPEPSKVGYCYDAPIGQKRTGGYLAPVTGHGDFVGNGLYFDGHVRLERTGS